MTTDITPDVSLRWLLLSPKGEMVLARADAKDTDTTPIYVRASVYDALLAENQRLTKERNDLSVKLGRREKLLSSVILRGKEAQAIISSVKKDSMKVINMLETGLEFIAAGDSEEAKMAGHLLELARAKINRQTGGDG